MTITNPDRVLFPDSGLTKADIADYYDAVADRMLPYLSRRPLTVERYPKGIGAKGFMQKNRPSHAPSFVGAIELDKRDGVTVYPVVGNRDGLGFFANLSAITFHVPTVTVIDDWHPDWVIWDLDPPEGGDDVVTAAAATMRSFLDGFGAADFPNQRGFAGRVAHVEQTDGFGMIEYREADRIHIDGYAFPGKIHLVETLLERQQTFFLN